MNLNRHMIGMQYCVSNLFCHSRVLKTYYVFCQVCSVSYAVNWTRRVIVIQIVEAIGTKWTKTAKALPGAMENNTEICI